MIRVYFLQVIRENDTDTLIGISLIHDALLDTTEYPTIRKLTMFTTPAEHNTLDEVCISCRTATQEEIDRYHAQVVIEPPNPDLIRASELLATSPDVITQPEIWELLRIFGKLHGIN